MDIELLISVVQKFPLLWDTAEPDYKDKNKKSNAWVKVSKSLFEDFGNCSEEQKKLTIQDVISKWRTIRDNYVRNLKKQSLPSGSGAKKTRTYIYGEQLSFLKKNLEPRPISSTASTVDVQPGPLDPNSNETENENNEVEEECEAAVMNKRTQEPVTSRKRKVPNIEQRLIDFMDAQKIKRATPEEDDDIAFFYSVLPTVKQLTPYEKFTFRIESMKLLQNIQQARSFVPTVQLESNTPPLPSNTSAASYTSSHTPDPRTSNDSLDCI